MNLWKPGRSAFVTGDTHFGDAVAFARYARPFANLDAMDDALVAAINARVGANDVLLHLGDFAHEAEWNKRERTRLRALRDRIACRRIVLVGGNVDPTGQRWFDGMFVELHDILTWKGWPSDRQSRPLRVVASHYPMRQWQGWLKGAVHLYGHAHGTLPEEGRSLDVGVDCWSFAPVELASLLDMLAARSLVVPESWPRRQPMRSGTT